MNKMMLLPMAFLLILVVYANVYTGVNYEPDDYSGYGDEVEIVIDNETHTIELPERPTTFSIWSATTILAILVAAIAVGIVSGISILGSGLSESAQKMSINSIIYMGIWASLSIGASKFLMNQPLLLLLWMIITMIYVIGFGSHITSGD